MRSPTKFNTMVAEAFKKKALAVTLEIEDKKVTGVTYWHENIEFVRDEVDYILTKIHPNILFIQSESKDNTTYEDKALDLVIKWIQDKLWKIMIIDKVRTKYEQIIWLIIGLSLKWKQKNTNIDIASQARES